MNSLQGGQSMIYASKQDWSKRKQIWWLKVVDIFSVSKNALKFSQGNFSKTLTKCS